MMYLRKVFYNKYINYRRNVLNFFFASAHRKKLKKDFTIISNNCWGGLLYPYYGLPYMSPTAGLYFFDEDYIKFVSNLEEYIQFDLKFINAYHSKHRKQLFEKGQEKCPIGVLGDVEIVFLHYKTQEEAKTKWDRRKQRICWDNIILKFSQSKKTKIEVMEQFDKLPYKKVIFVIKDYHLKSQIIYPEYEKIGGILNDTDYITKHFEPTALINS